MFEVSNQGFLRSLSPFRPSPGVPRGPRHVYHVSHLENLTFDLIELQQCAKGVDRGFQGCQVHLDVSHMAHVAMDMPTTCSTHYHILKFILLIYFEYRTAEWRLDSINLLTFIVIHLSRDGDENNAVQRSFVGYESSPISRNVCLSYCCLIPVSMTLQRAATMRLSVIC